MGEHILSNATLNEWRNQIQIKKKDEFKTLSSQANKNRKKSFMPVKEVFPRNSTSILSIYRDDYVEGDNTDEYNTLSMKFGMGNIYNSYKSDIAKSISKVKQFKNINKLIKGQVSEELQNFILKNNLFSNIKNEQEFGRDLTSLTKILNFFFFYIKKELSPSNLLYQYKMALQAYFKFIHAESNLIVVQQANDNLSLSKANANKIKTNLEEEIRKKLEYQF